MSDWFNKEKLHFAADEGNLERVKELVKQGYDVNAFDEVLSYTPLHYAVKGEHINVARYLLSVGANVNAHDEENIGETPLGAVSDKCSYEIAELLINAGANPTIPGWMQMTALDRAKNRKNQEGLRVYELLSVIARNKYHYNT